jgi:RNA polymerase sigma-70 factor (ECF subfamily)
MPGQSEQVSGPDDGFVARVIATQSRLYRYVASLVPVRADAEDILQKTLLTAWQERTRFDPSRDFFAWVCGMARNHVRHYYRSLSRARTVLAPDVLDELADRLLEEDEYLERRQRALSECLDRLPAKQRQLVEQFYRTDRTTQELAAELGWGLQALYKALQRVRAALHDCITAALAREGQE